MEPEREVSARGFFLTWAALMLLAAVSLGLSYAHLGAFNTPIALLIALAKAVLVALFFMELWGQRFTVRITLVTAASLLALLALLLSVDVLTRPTPALLPSVVETPVR